MAVTVFTKTVCAQCRATKKKLDSLGVEYDLVNIEDDPSARDKLVEMGFLQVPVVEADSEYFSGYRPDKLEALSKS